jgi:L-asparaginase II
VANGATLTRLHSNCSGKHAAMLALAAHRGWPKAGYELPEHPVQRACHAEVAAWSGADPLPWATDGCGVPTFILPLARMAQAYARLAVVAEGGAVPGGGPSDDSQRAAARLVAAVAADPFLIAGTGRLDTDLIVATNGRIVAKVGADGVYCVALRDAGLGVALKVEDGAVRALAPALLALLDVLAPGAAPAAELESWRRRLVLNSNGLTVGEIRGRVELVNGAPKG